MAVDLDADTLERIHHIELELLIEIDRICQKNDIKYSLTGGTLLGAVRNGDFIPWDDDADISMLRKEYVKFQKACAVDLDHSRFYFQDIENTHGYRWGYGKLRRKKSIFLREHQGDMPYEQGIFLDIFPRDGIPDNLIQRKIHDAACFCVRKMMWSQIGYKVEENIFIKGIYWLLSRISHKHLRMIYKGLIHFSNRAETRLLRALTFPLPHGVKGYDRKWYNEYTRIKLAGHDFMVEASYIDWLSREFGDYTKLPPPEKRKAHPVSKIEFPKDM